MIVGKATFEAYARTYTDSVIAGKVDDEYPLSFRLIRATIPTVSKIDDETEALEGHVLEKSVVPGLRFEKRD